MLSLLLSLPVALAGVTGLLLAHSDAARREAIEKVVDQRIVARGQALKLPAARVRLMRAAAARVFGLLPTPQAYATLLGLAALLAATALASGRPRRADRTAQAEFDTSGALPLAERMAMPKLSRKEARRILKAAQSLERSEGAEAAGELLVNRGLQDAAVDLYLRHERFDQAAQIRHDQGRFDQAAELFRQAGKPESAGAIYAQLERFEEAARCYLAAGKSSVAGELFERASNFREAARCYRAIDFHRHAAKAYLRAGLEAEAAQSLVSAFEDEGGGGVNLDEDRATELRSLASKAAELYCKLERFDEAESVLVRAGAYARAAQVAFQSGAYDRAADLFLRIGRGDLAAKALERSRDEIGAARVLGEYLREKGQDEKAVKNFEKAGEFSAAADLYRKLDRYEEAGECYWKAEIFEAAAEMFHAGGLLARAGEAFERCERYDDAAGCFAEAGEGRRQAQMLEQAGQLLEAGRRFAGLTELDEAIRVLQVIDSDHAQYGEACSLLGGIFREKGMHSLSLKKFEEATGSGPLSRTNVDAYYQFAEVLESREDVERTVEIYEKILSFDYHYGDVSARLARAKERRERSGSDRPAGAKAASSTAQTDADEPRYGVTRELGRGGMGVVYLAMDRVLEREVAYKVLPEGLRGNANALKNFLREAKAAAQLNHPNIVTVYDAGDSEHGFYLAMEFVDGTTLKEIVQRRGAIAPGGAVYIMRQMAEALSYAHSKRVVHRDIKTANTMWTTDKQVKIMDFGLAKLMEEVRTATTLVSGTPFYMSPEQTLGKHVDHRTDIYSLGVMMFELVTGLLPFRQGNVPYHHVHTPPPHPREVKPDVPEALAEIILRCLEKDPDARYAEAAEISEILQPSGNAGS